MATTLTHNLKLRLDSNLTASAKYNLERLDLLGGTFLVDSTDTLKIRSRTDLLIEPESADLGGSGTGGNVSIGSAGNKVAEFSVHADTISLDGAFGLLDTAVGGTRNLLLKYKSDINGLVDTTADRSLRIDLDGSDRDLVLGGNLGITGDVTLIVPTASTITIPSSGVLSTLAGTETLTNKTIDASANTLLGISNANIDSGAAIDYSKLNLAGSILNSDISPSAAIAYSKLSLANSIADSDIDSGSALDEYVLTADGAGGASWQPQSGGGGGGGGRDAAATWSTADGTTKTITHNWGTRKIQVEVLDNDNSYETIEVTVQRPTDNTVVVSSSSAPGTAWTVTLKEVT